MNDPAWLREPTTRRPTLLDLMLLIAAAALGLGLVRLTGVAYRGPADSQDKLWWIGILMQGVRTGWTFLAPLAPALLLRQLAAPERWRKPVWQRPGIVAGAAITLTLVVQGSYLGVVAVTMGQRYAQDAGWRIALLVGIDDATARGYLLRSNHAVEEWGTRATFAVLGAWLTLFLAGAWQAEPTWVDRLGRLVGLLGIFGYLVMLVGTIAALFV